MLVSLTLGPKPFDIRMDWEDYHDHSTLNEFIGDAFFHMEISLSISDLIVSTFRPHICYFFSTQIFFHTNLEQNGINFDKTP